MNSILNNNSNEDDSTKLNRIMNTTAQKQFNRLGTNANTISLSTSSPLIAKYMNLSTFSSTSNTSSFGGGGGIGNNTSNDDKTSLSLNNSGVENINENTSLNSTNSSNNSASVASRVLLSSVTAPQQQQQPTALNPESYLSTKLNQTRAAREAFLKGNLRPTTISIANNGLNKPQQQQQTTTTTTTTNTNSPKLNTSSTSNNTTTTTDTTNNNRTSTFSTASTAIQNKLQQQLSNENMKYLSNNNNNQQQQQQQTNGHNGHQNDTTSNALAAKVRNLDGYVGFVNLPNQVYRKAVKKGFDFNLMVIGESGLGKSTFINSLFLSELYNAEFPGTSKRKKKTVNVDSSTVLLTEKGVNLRLTVVDTPGFGESIDNTNCWQPIIDYVDLKYEEYLNQESRVNRKQIVDDRVHCCLYFISPGHSLKQLDIEVMKKLHDRVNLIPVIAKADTMTIDEIKEFKKVILNEINANKIQIYEFPDVEDDDIETSKLNNLLKSKLPFAIVGSNTVLEVDGKTVRGRQYPWGVVNVDDLNHCDFMALRTMLIRTHMQDLKDVTNNVHYENYRYKKLINVAGDKAKLPNNKNPFQQLDDERRESEMRLQKMKAEMEAVFEQKVKEKIARLKESEASLEKQQETMKLTLEKEEKELEQQRMVFLREMQQWEDANREDEERLKQTLGKELDKKKKKIF